MKKLKIKIFADGADTKKIISLNRNSIISGFTTNPSLMNKENILDYKTYSKKILKFVKTKPLSFEVTSDTLNQMEKQALEIASWSKNIYVKIPFLNSKGKNTIKLISKLANRGIKINVTALFTHKQALRVLNALTKDAVVYLSIFAGRIADTGRDPSIIIKKTVKSAKKYKNVNILWASCRQIYSIFEAEKLGCHIITVPHDMLKKMNLINKNLDKYALETSKEFFIDSKKIKFSF